MPDLHYFYLVKIPCDACMRYRDRCPASPPRYVEGLAKLKGHTRSMNCSFVPPRLLRQQIFFSKNYNVRTLLQLTLCTPGILSEVGQVAPKQSTQTLIPNAYAPSWLPKESRKINHWKVEKHNYLKKGLIWNLSKLLKVAGGSKTSDSRQKSNVQSNARRNRDKRKKGEKPKNNLALPWLPKRSLS